MVAVVRREQWFPTGVPGSGVTDGEKKDESHPWQAKCKNRAPTYLIFRFLIVYIVFLPISEYFPVI